MFLQRAARQAVRQTRANCSAWSATYASLGLTVRGGFPSLPPAKHTIFMGQQNNKVEKRRRRQRYLERQEVKAKEAAALAKPAKKKVAPKKAAAETAAAE